MKSELTKLLETLYQDSDLVCIMFKPSFENKTERWMTVADLKTDRWQNFLKAANAHECNVYLSLNSFTAKNRSEVNVTKETDKIFLDFDDEAAYNKFNANVKNPNVIIQSSPEKHQVILKTDIIENHRIKAAAETMSILYGADHTHDLSRMFRVPGFRNHKYENAPMAKLLKCDNTIFPIGDIPCNPAFIKKHKELLMAKRGEVTRQETGVVMPMLRNDRRERTSLNAYSKYLNMTGIRSSDGLPDFSKADFYYATYLCGQGYNEFTTTTMVKHGRLEAEQEMNIPPDAKMEVKHKDIDRYLRKTVEAASGHQARKFKPPVAQNRTKSITIQCNPKTPPPATKDVPMMTEEEEKEFIALNQDAVFETAPARQSVVKGMRIR